MREVYARQVRLLLHILDCLEYETPAGESFFALKGGTALNFFVQPFPRLSADIDLTYCPLDERDAALAAMRESLQRLAEVLQARLPGVQCAHTRPADGDKLLVRFDGASVKVEPNGVIRGTVFPTAMLPLQPEAQAAFGVTVNARCLGTADLYGGKICAALDRQHPRDLFDILPLMQSDSLEESTRKAFLVYALSHPRPLANALLRDVMRKLPESSRSVWQEELERYRKVVNQERQDTNKIYSLHEPEVCCVSKGKEHKKYEFGAKAAIVTTKTNCIIVGAKGFRNEYYGDTLKGVLAQVADIRGSAPEKAFCDRGFRGRKKVGGTAIVLPESPSPKTTEHFKRKARKNFGRRSAIEPVIGHLKNNFRLARNYLKGTIGDAINLLMAAAAFDCRKWMNGVAERLLFVLFTLCSVAGWKKEYQPAMAL